MRLKPTNFDSSFARLGRLFSLALAVGVIGLSILTLEIGIPGDAHAASAANAQSPLGINLNGFNYYSSEMPLMNIFATAGQWITHSGATFDTKEEQYLNLDSNGWPMTLTAVKEAGTQQFTTVGVLLMRMNSTSNGYYPAGQYIVLYDGQGTLNYGFDAALVSRSTGRDVINVAAPTSGGIDLRITATDPNHTGNYIRNIRLVKATNESAFNAGHVFNPAFLSLIQKFRALRFMDWLATNGSTLSAWSTRPLLTDPFWGTSKGVPIELTVQLANATGADAWLNVPHMADDNYISQMATLVHAQLGKAQKAYVEFSNEVWNGAFAQYQYAVSQGKSLWPTQPAGGGGFAWNRNWYGMRNAQMCDIWKSAWGADANRVVCVLAAQAAGSYSATESLACPYWTAGAPCSAHNINAVAIAPYFGYAGVPATWISQADGGLTDLFQSLYSQNAPSIAAGGSFNQTAAWEADYRAALAPYKLPMIGYESGQSFANGSTSALNNLYISANRDPRMAAAYTTYLNQWKSSGGQLLMLYSDVSGPGSYGSWGALESIMQTTTPLNKAPPKWQAIQNFLAATPCWWSGCVGTISTTSAVSTPMAPSNLKVQ
jgi:hypothetical protein